MSRRKEQDRDIADPIDAAALAWVDSEGSAMIEHPDPDELVDYQEGRLDGQRVERLQRHLLICPDCREDLLRLHTFNEEVSDQLVPSDEATDRSWQRFLRERTAPDTVETEQPSSLPGFANQSSGLRWRLAASIFLALAVGAILTALLLGRDTPNQVADAESPFVFDLDPTGTALVRDVAVLPVIVVPAGMDPLVPRLNLGDLTAHESYLVEVYDDSGQLAVRRPDLVRGRSGSVTFLVHRTEWPAGEYQVTLIALDASRRQELASYAFRLGYEK